MKRFGLTVAVVDVDATRTLQAGTASFTPAHTMKEISGYQLPKPEQVANSPVPEASAQGSLERFEEMNKALPLALYDYMLKSGTDGFAISLSGGADSAACAVLVRLMVENAVAELGLETVVTQLHLWNVADEKVSIEALTHLLLTCFYQGTRNSSETTLRAATKVAEELGAQFFNIDVDSLVEDYKERVSEALDCSLDWKTHDLALQNIQARVRAPSGWLIANLGNKLLVTTSNRSEAAVGYCTMDGDTAGSIAPIGGVDKAFLLEWLRYLADSRYPSLWHIVDQKPTAELRPGESQTDEADLMPYPILQAIETCAIQQKKGPIETFETLAPKSDLPTQLLFSYIRKFFRLWCQNQWKRERYALSFHVDSRNLDPRSWCRFPVLNGGYRKELEELRVKLGAK
jgi:NAD+ synthase (glutamine-hydrolysing)